MLSDDSTNKMPSTTPLTWPARPNGGRVATTSQPHRRYPATILVPMPRERPGTPATSPVMTPPAPGR